MIRSWSTGIILIILAAISLQAVHAAEEPAEFSGEVVKTQDIIKNESVRRDRVCL